MDKSIEDALARYVQIQLGADAINVLAFSHLSGGAIQSNYALTVECTGGRRPGKLELVVRSDSASTISASLTREQEFKVLTTAFEAGVTVPEPLWLCTDKSVIGNAFCVMTRIRGTASGRVLVKQDRTAEQSAGLVAQLGLELGRLHKVRPPLARLGFLPMPEPTPALSRVHEYRKALDAIPEPHPVLEWALNWLQDHAPQGDSIVLCHCDFRTGNYMVDEGRLTGVLDWEFAAWSDPYEDLGWLCAKSWRFGAKDKPVGGIGYKPDLFDAYSSVAGHAVDADKVLYWEVMGMVRWAVIALQQAQRHLSGEEPSLELALTGRLVPEMEFDLLNQINEMAEAL